MSGLCILLVLGYLGYRLSKRAPRTRTRLRDRWSQPAQTTPPVTRAQASGDAGEAAVHAELRRVLTWLCGDDFHLHEGAVLIHHAPGTEFPTAEIDHIAVTPFGIFVIETKNWTGSISLAARYEDIVRTGHGGVPELRRSPIAQNRTKVAFLEAKLPRVWPIEGVAVFASPACTLHPDLSISIIHISELAHWLRQQRRAFDHSGRRSVDVRLAWQAIMRNASISDAELENHRKHLRNQPKVFVSDAV